jgi:hypothetical protein
MPDSQKPQTNWRNLLFLALSIGVGSAIGRMVTEIAREKWGYWPAVAVGAAAAGLTALLFALLLWALVRSRDSNQA